MICETPMEHWTVAMEAYALAFDDPFEAWRTEHGDRIGLAFDLEWESLEVAAQFNRSAHVQSKRYDVSCEVNGVLQVGDEEWTIAATGSRHHEWGILDWSAVAPYNRTHNLDTVDSRFLAEAPLQIEIPNGSPKRLLFTLEQRLADRARTLGWLEVLEKDH
jgi:hypothetical protein